jgi:hypothetical protein
VFCHVAARSADVCRSNRCPGRSHPSESPCCNFFPTTLAARSLTIRPCSALGWFVPSPIYCLLAASLEEAPLLRRNAFEVGSGRLARGAIGIAWGGGSSEQGGLVEGGGVESPAGVAGMFPSLEEHTVLLGRVA